MAKVQKIRPIKPVLAAQDQTKLAARIARMTKWDCAGCLVWKGAKNNYGYGKMNLSVKGKSTQLYAHRVMYVLATGREIPANRVLDHKCQNPYCVNPAHLQLVAPETNAKFSWERTLPEAQRAPKARTIDLPYAPMPAADSAFMAWVVSGIATGRPSVYVH